MRCGVRECESVAILSDGPPVPLLLHHLGNLTIAARALMVLPDQAGKAASAAATAS